MVPHPVGHSMCYHPFLEGAELWSSTRVCTQYDVDSGDMGWSSRTRLLSSQAVLMMGVQGSHVWENELEEGGNL